jgi:hypothetical protein
LFSASSQLEVGKLIQKGMGKGLSCNWHSGNPLSFFSASYLRIDSMRKLRDRHKLKTEEDRERIFLISDQAIIKNGQETIKLADLDVDDTIVVIGSNNRDKGIKAKMIRIFQF